MKTLQLTKLHESIAPIIKGLSVLMIPMTNLEFYAKSTRFTPIEQKRVLQLQSSLAKHLTEAFNDLESLSAQVEALANNDNDQTVVNEVRLIVREYVHAKQIYSHLNDRLTKATDHVTDIPVQELQCG